MLIALPSTSSAQGVTLESYSSVLQQIADAKLSIIQQEHQIEEQKSEIAFLREQISLIAPTTAGIDEMIDKMANQIEDAVNSDIPFNIDERGSRILKLKADLQDDNLSVGTKYRRALNAYGVEVNYGFEIDSYQGPAPLNPGESPNIVSLLDDEGKEVLDENTGEILMLPEEGDYLRYGRMALVFLNQRGTKARRYDPVGENWVDLGANDLLEVRRAIRISKGQSAPAVLLAPIYKQ